MQNFTRLRILLFFTLFIASVTTFGQGIFHELSRYEHAKESGRNVNSWLRYEAGYSYPIANATYVDDYTTTDYYGNPVEKRVSKTIHATSTMGVTAGTFFPVGYMGENCVLAIGLAARGNIYKWSTGDISVAPNQTYNYDYLTMELGLPVSMDLKWGCDAFMDKSRATCFTLGVGGYPAYVMTGLPTGLNADGSVNVSGKGQFVVEPFVKAEAGFMLGICWKVRAMYNFGYVKYFSYEADNENITLSGKSNFTLSLIIMPFSWDWEKGGF